MNEILQKLYTEFKGVEFIEVLPYFEMIKYFVESNQLEELSIRLNDLKESGYLSDEFISRIKFML